MPITSSDQAIEPSAKLGKRGLNCDLPIAVSRVGSRISATTVPPASKRNMAGIMRLVRSSSAKRSAGPLNHQPAAMSLAPSSMKLSPRPRMMPTATGRLSRSATLSQSPLTSGQTSLAMPMLPLP